jgi:hypothetical protein
MFATHCCSLVFNVFYYKFYLSKAKGMSTTLFREDCLLFRLVTCKVGGWVIGKLSLLIFVVLALGTL